jgi:hypothetical protein
MAKEGIKPIIVAYLEDRAKNDELFAKAYAKENKSIDECIDFIFSEAHKMGNAVCVSDAEVFGWAVHYYDEDNIKINKTAGTRRRASAGIDDIELTDEEKAELRANAEKEYIMEVRSELINKDKRAKAAKREKEQQAQSLMGSLF